MTDYGWASKCGHAEIIVKRSDLLKAHSVIGILTEKIQTVHSLCIFPVSWTVLAMLQRNSCQDHNKKAINGWKAHVTAAEMIQNWRSSIS
jgi:hypothetical protein